jgi:hypothetical protein
MARLCTKGILYRGARCPPAGRVPLEIGLLPARDPRLTTAQPVVTGLLPSDNLTMGVGLLYWLLLMMTKNHGTPPPEAGRFFIYIYVVRIWLGHRLARAARLAHRSVSPVRTALLAAPILTSRPCTHFTPAAGGPRAGLKGRPPNGQLQTARPLRCGSLRDKPADETASTGPDGPSVSERVRAGPNDDAASTDADVSSPAGGPFGALRAPFGVRAFTA